MDDDQQDAPAELTADEIAAAAGPVDEDKTIQLALEDGRTLVARVRTVQEGDHKCQVDGCHKRYENEKNLQTHVGRSHPETTARTCPACNEDFTAPPSRTQRYCSERCRVDALMQEKICPGCEREFVTSPENTEREREYCSTWCVYEDRRSDERPDSYAAARRELEGEGHEGEALLGRLLCALGPGWSRAEVRTRFGIDENDDETYREVTERVATRDDVDLDQDELVENYLRRIIEEDADISDRIQVATVLEAIEEADSLRGASEILRISRSRTRVLFTRMGVKDEVDSYTNLRSQMTRGEVTVSNGDSEGENGVTDGGRTQNEPGEGSSEDEVDGDGGQRPVWERQRRERL